MLSERPLGRYLNQFCPSVPGELFSSHFTAVYVSLSVGWQLSWAADWHLRVQIGSLHPCFARARDKCGERWGRERSPGRDWYRCHWERSEPCLNKRGHRFCRPLNKQGDKSASSLCCAVTGGYQPLQNNSSHQHRPYSLMSQLWSFFCICHGFCIVILPLHRNEALFLALMPFFSLHFLHVFYLIELCGELLGHCCTRFPSC